MDDESRIRLFEDVYRRRYRNDLPGLQRLINALVTEASESVVITQQGFEGGQATGQVTNEASIRLRAALNVQAELDPDTVPDEPDRGATLANFSCGRLET